jgi:ABC-type transport system involved in multi-copper enzyme maturation permease subunit
LLTIYGFTLKEVIRKRFLLIALILVVIFLTVYGVGLRFTFRSIQDQPRIMRELIVSQLMSVALYMSSFISAFLVVFSAAGTFASEIEGEDLQAVVAKPIGRWQIILGKYFGLATMCIGFNMMLLFAIIGASVLVAAQQVRNLPGVIGLFCLQPLVLLSVTIAASLHLKTITAGITGILVYMVGVIGGMVEQIGTLIDKSSPVVTVGMVSRLIIPTDVLYRFIFSRLTGRQLRAMTDAGPFGSMVLPGEWMIGYAAAYCVFFLCLSVFCFSKKDL